MDTEAHNAKRRDPCMENAAPTSAISLHSEDTPSSGEDQKEKRCAPSKENAALTHNTARHSEDTSTSGEDQKERRHGFHTKRAVLTPMIVVHHEDTPLPWELQFEVKQLFALCHQYTDNPMNLEYLIIRGHTEILLEEEIEINKPRQILNKCGDVIRTAHNLLSNERHHRQGVLRYRGCDCRS